MKSKWRKIHHFLKTRRPPSEYPLFHRDTPLNTSKGNGMTSISIKALTSRRPNGFMSMSNKYSLHHKDWFLLPAIQNSQGVYKKSTLSEVAVDWLIDIQSKKLLCGGALEVRTFTAEYLRSCENCPKGEITGSSSFRAGT